MSLLIGIDGLMVNPRWAAISAALRWSLLAWCREVLIALYTLSIMQSAAFRELCQCRVSDITAAFRELCQCRVSDITIRGSLHVMQTLLYVLFSRFKNKIKSAINMMVQVCAKEEWMKYLFRLLHIFSILLCWVTKCERILHVAVIFSRQRKAVKISFGVRLVFYYKCFVSASIDGCHIIVCKVPGLMVTWSDCWPTDAEITNHRVFH